MDRSMADARSAPRARSGPLDEERPSVVVDVRSRTLDIVHVTAAWRAELCDVSGTLSDVSSARLQSHLCEVFAEMVVAALECHRPQSRAIVGLLLQRSDGTAFQANLGVTVPHPEFWTDSLCPARLTLRRLRAAKVPRRSGRSCWAPALCTVPEDCETSSAPAAAPIAHRLLEVDFVDHPESTKLSL